MTDVTNFFSFLKENNIMEAAIATVFSRMIADLSYSFIDNILLPIFKIDLNNDGKPDLNSFINMILNANIQGGLIDVDTTSFEWKDYASVKFFDSLIYVKNGELFLDGKSQIIINDYNSIYKFLVTPKNFRNEIKTINLNYIYNFDRKTIKIEDIKIDNVFNEKVNKIINNIAIKNNDLQNKIFLKNLVNEAIKNYAG